MGLDDPSKAGVSAMRAPNGSVALKTAIRKVYGFDESSMPDTEVVRLYKELDEVDGIAAIAVATLMRLFGGFDDAPALPRDASPALREREASARNIFQKARSPDQVRKDVANLLVEAQKEEFARFTSPVLLLSVVRLRDQVTLASFSTVARTLTSVELQTASRRIIADVAKAELQAGDRGINAVAACQMAYEIDAEGELVAIVCPGGAVADKLLYECLSGLLCAMRASFADLLTCSMDDISEEALAPILTAQVKLLSAKGEGNLADTRELKREEDEDPRVTNSFELEDGTCEIIIEDNVNLEWVDNSPSKPEAAAEDRPLAPPQRSPRNDAQQRVASPATDTISLFFAKNQPPPRPSRSSSRPSRGSTGDASNPPSSRTKRIPKEVVATESQAALVLEGGRQAVDRGDETGGLGEAAASIQVLKNGRKQLQQSFVKPKIKSKPRNSIQSSKAAPRSFKSANVSPEAQDSDLDFTSYFQSSESPPRLDSSNASGTSRENPSQFAFKRESKPDKLAGRNRNQPETVLAISNFMKNMQDTAGSTKPETVLAISSFMTRMQESRLSETKVILKPPEEPKPEPKPKVKKKKGKEKGKEKKKSPAVSQSPPAPIRMRTYAFAPRKGIE
jgi:hypothetical protein